MRAHPTSWRATVPLAATVLLAACSTDMTTAARTAPGARPSAVVITSGDPGGPTSAAGIVPRFFSGNDNQPGDRNAAGTCARLTGMEGIKGAKLDDPGLKGQLGPVSFTRDADNVYLSWAAPAGVKVELISMKGGNGYNLYGYDQSGTGYTHDEGLAPPPNASGSSAQISHVIACYTDGGSTEHTTLAVEKDASTSYRRSYAWTIGKLVGGQKALSVAVPKSGSYTASYSVKVEQTGVSDDQFRVYGDIRIYNPGPATASVTGVTDNLAEATVNACAIDGTAVGVPSQANAVSLEKDKVMTCGYTATRSNADAGVNSATVTATGQGVTPSVSTIDVPFAFGDPSMRVNQTVTVTDAFNGGAASSIPGYANPTQLTATDAAPYTSHTYTYPRQITVPSTAACGSTVQYPNTATLSTGATSSASVTATAQCGCTPGYWSNTRQAYPMSLTSKSLLKAPNAFSTIATPSWFTGATFATAWTWSSGTTDDDMRRQMSRHGAAALLNSYAVAGFAIPTADVRSLVAEGLTAGRARAEAIKNQLQAANEAGCPLSNR